MQINELVSVWLELLSFCRERVNQNKYVKMCGEEDLIITKVLLWLHEYVKRSFKKWKMALRKKCPYSEFFCSVFSCIRTEYGEIQSECGKNTDQKNSEYGHFWRSVVSNFIILSLKRIKLVINSKYSCNIYSEKLLLGK